MRGYVEESPVVTARRRLMAAARRYAGRYLVFDAREVDEAEEQLVNASVALADAIEAERPGTRTKRRRRASQAPRKETDR